MENILIPTDFSACANQAADAAAKLAQRMGARLHILTCIDIPENWHERSPLEQSKDAEALQRIYNASLLLNDLRHKYAELEVTTAYSSKQVYREVARYVQRHGIQLVVMGSHGASGKNEYFIGSNTQKVVREVHCPVLVIKEPLASIDFKRVVFASNFHEDELNPFLRFKAFIEPFEPEIHLVEVHTSSLFDPPYLLSQEAMDRFRALCVPFPCKIHVHRDFSIERGIRSFAQDIGAQLIAISNRHRHPLKRMFVGSNVEALVNHSHIPVLSIDYEARTEKIMVMPPVP
jgi:nucleotide-binding universal stress UspA family protein